MNGVWRMYWGYLDGVSGCLWCSDVSEEILQVENLHYFGTALKAKIFSLDILRRRNIKVSTYVLNKNGWVLPFFGFLVPVRDGLKNTVTWITL
jgi:hypothetical protein